jgi:hypothetical protein
MVMTYRGVGTCPGGGSYRTFYNYFLEVADRAIKLWGLKEGRFDLKVGKDTPICDGVNPASCAIFGSVRSVLARLFARKMARQSVYYGLSTHTIQAIVNSRSYEDSAESMRCIYYAGSLLITKDKEKYEYMKGIACEYIH